MISSTDRAIGVVRCGSPDWVWLVSGISVAEDSEGVWLLGCPAGGAFVAQVWLTKHTQAGVTCLWGVVSPNMGPLWICTEGLIGYALGGHIAFSEDHRFAMRGSQSSVCCQDCIAGFYRVQGGTHGTPSESLCKCSRQEICLLSSDQFPRVSLYICVFYPLKYITFCLED